VKSFNVIGKASELNLTVSRDFCDLNIGVHEISISFVGFDGTEHELEAFLQLSCSSAIGQFMDKQGKSCMQQIPICSFLLSCKKSTFSHYPTRNWTRLTSRSLQLKFKIDLFNQSCKTIPFANNSVFYLSIHIRRVC